jgi:hypothetical protein
MTYQPDFGQRIGRAAFWLLAGTLLLMPAAATTQTAVSAAGPGTPVVANAAAPRAVSLSKLPQISGLAVPRRAVPRPLTPFLSESQYLAAKNAAAKARQAPQSGPLQPPSPALPAPGLPLSSAVTPETPKAATIFIGNMEDTCGSYVPSDQALAVGDSSPPYPVLQVNNACISIFTRAGARAPGYPKSLQAFFGADPTLFIFDPRALYDWVNHRYIITAVQINGKVGSYYVAVSAGPDPAGVYFVYHLPSKTSGAYPDFLRVGQDRQAIYTAGNMFNISSSAYLYEQLDLLPKAQMYAGATFNYYSFPNLAGSNFDSTQPANVFSPTDNPRAEFMVTSKNSCTSPCNGLYLWAVSNPLISPGSPGPEISRVAVATVHSYTMAPSAIQAGSDATIDTLDTRISGEVTYASGALYASLNTANGSGGAGALLFKYQPFLNRNNDKKCPSTSSFYNQCPDIVSARALDEPFLNYGGTSSAFFATQQPDLEGNTTTVFSYSTAVLYPSTVYLSRRVTQPPFTFADSGIFAALGKAPFLGFRWGDYTAVAPELTTGLPNLWFAAQYSFTGNLWRTVIGQNAYTAANQP